MLTTIIGRGHSGTRAMSHIVSASGVWMGEALNGSGDLLPPQAMYEASRLISSPDTFAGSTDWSGTSAVSTRCRLRPSSNR